MDKENKKFLKSKEHAEEKKEKIEEGTELEKEIEKREKARAALAAKEAKKAEKEKKAKEKAEAKKQKEEEKNSPEAVAAKEAEKAEKEKLAKEKAEAKKVAKEAKAKEKAEAKAAKAKGKADAPKKEAKADDKGTEKAKGAGIHSIKVRLLAAFMVPIVCMIVLGTVSYNSASDTLLEQGVNNMNQTVGMMSEYYQSAIENIQARINNFYMDMPDYVDGSMNGTETAVVQKQNSTLTSMKDIIRADNTVANIYLLTPKAKNITTTLKVDEGMYEDFLATPAGQQSDAIRLDYQWFGINSEVDEILGVKEEGTYIFRMVRSFLHEDAFLICDVREEVIIDVMKSLDFGEGSIMGVVSADGTEIAYANGEREINAGYFKNKAEFVVPETDTDESAEEAEPIIKEKEPVYVEYEGETYLFLESDIVDGQLKVCVLVPKAELLEPTLVIRNITVILVIIACILAIATGLTFANNIGGVIKKINKHLGKVANGDLTARFNLKSKDEFAVLAKSVNHMTDNVANLVGEVHSVGGELLGIVQNVADTTNHFVHTATVIKTSVKEIEEGVNQLDESSSNSLSQMDILSSQFEQLNNNASSIGKATDCTVETINEGLDIMQDLNEKTSDTTAMMDKVTNTMKLLQTKISEINDIVNAIDDIASQTELLSLNASIEAARAGDSGRGFSVVADEIRKLADQSMVSANEIRSIISEINAQTTIAGQSVNNACDSVEKQKSAVEKTTNSFHMMDEQTRVLTEQIKEILGYIETMVGAKTTTEDAIQNISAATSETAASSAEVYSTAEAQSTEAINLQQATERMLKQANQLEQAIKKFTV